MHRYGKRFLAIFCVALITMTGCGQGSKNVVGSDAASVDDSKTVEEVAETETAASDTAQPEEEKATEEEEESNITPPFLADEDLYKDVISGLSEDSYYAFADVGLENDILIVAKKDTVFDNGDDTMASTEGDVYLADKDGKITELGHIDGGGTAAPLAVGDGFILYANHESACSVKVNDDKTGLEINEAASMDDYDKALTLNFTPVSDAETSADSNAKTELPVYEYSEKNTVEAEIYKYLIEKIASQYDKCDVTIPIVQIVATDDSNTDDIQVYGDFWVNNYDLDGETLMTASGGNYPGVMHLKVADEGYEVTSFDVVEDGSEFDASAKKLFGDHYDDFMKIYSDSEKRDSLRTEIIAEYVQRNSLPITQYQDFGWDPVLLGDAEGYYGPEDFVQEQSGKTEFADFEDVISNLKEGQGYATINLYGCDVDILVVAETVFEADHSAPDASLYADIGSGAHLLTTVAGNGSAFPLRYADGILYGGSNHEYISYFAYENEERVGVMVKDCVTDGDGAGEYSGFLRDDNSYDNDKKFTGGQKEFEEMLAEREEKPILEFTVVK